MNAQADARVRSIAGCRRPLCSQMPEIQHRPPHPTHTRLVRVFLRLKMKITNDPIHCKAAIESQYAELFRQLTPESNCIVFETKAEMDRVSQALDGWSRRFLGKGTKVRTTARYVTDGKPRCWLVFPEAATPPKTVVRGNFPK